MTHEPFNSYAKQNGEVIFIYEWLHDHSKKDWYNHKVGFSLVNCHTGKCQDVKLTDFVQWVNDGKLKFLSKCERR